MKPQFDVVIGGFGYSGRYISRRLLDQGHSVRVLTNSIHRPHPFGNFVEAFALTFEDVGKLTEMLTGADVLYNTYWVRFDHASFSQAAAIQNSLNLFNAAKGAGIRRIVHISITNPSESSSLPYFKGKARLERGIIEAGLSYAILRPAVLFGKEDILINNIAWTLRHLPIFGIFGDGSYGIRPIYVDDLARLAVEQGQLHENCTIDAVGPESFTFRELVHTISQIIKVRRPLVSVPPAIGYWTGWLIGKLMHDVFITRDEITGLMQGLLATDSPPTGITRLTDWAREHADTLGVHYASELKRRLDRTISYEDL
jgi:NADH dehydrogenase